MKTVTRLDPGNSRAFYTMGILNDKKPPPQARPPRVRKAGRLDLPEIRLVR